MAAYSQRLQEMARTVLASMQGKTRREYMLAGLLASGVVLAGMLMVESLARPETGWGMAFIYLLCAAAFGGRLVRIFR